jgi:C-terminal processing protease CtpA/Prc
MNKILLFILTAVIFTQISFGQQQSKYSAQQVKADFEYLYNTLEASHYDLYAHTKKEVFDKEYKRITESIADSLTLLQINRLFLPFVSLSKDAHCSLELPFGEYYNNYIRSGGTLFPFNVYFKDNRVFVLDNFSSDTSILSGDEIVSINGKYIKDIMNGIYKSLGGEDNYTKNIMIEAISFPRIFWMITGEYKNYNVSIKKHNGGEININISSVPSWEFEGKMAKRKPLPFMNQSRTFEYINDIAYLRPGTFYNAPKYEASQIKINSGMFDNKEFIHLLDSCFTVIHNKHTQVLIVDLRGNPGGTATFSNPMVAFFATEPFTIGTKFLVRISEISKIFWKEMNDTSQLFIDIKKEILSKENGVRFEMSTAKYKYPPRTDSLKFKGNVYVLINRFSGSQAIEVPAMIQHYGFGKLIGEQTAPLTDANARQFKLPNTQLTVMFPEAFYGDSSMANGVIPDYLINDDVLTEKDEILDYTLKLIGDGKDKDRR